MNELLRRWWLVPVLLVVVAGSVAVNIGQTSDDRPLAVVLAAAAALVLFAIDRWPLAVLVNGVLVGLYFAVPPGESGPVFFTVVIATFLVALGREVRQWLPLVVGSGVLVWAGLLVRGLRDDALDPGLWQSFAVGAMVAAAAAIATTVRARNEARADRAWRAASEEKLRMAQDLHDGVGHGLAVIAMQAGVGLHVLDRDPAATRATLEAIRDTSKEALAALRAELSQLAGDAAPRAPRRGLDDLEALATRVEAAGLAVERQVSLDGSLPADVEAAAYAIVQESLTNVLRHARASRVVLVVERGDDTLVVVVTDDGLGGAVQDEGMGLTGMRERATALGGSLVAGPVAGGFEVRAVLPL
jgi:signal transduction histidine kinase